MDSYLFERTSGDYAILFVIGAGASASLGLISSPADRGTRTLSAARCPDQNIT